jgi:hypothetical protein
MKMNFTTALAGVALLGAMSMTSCKKKGCMDAEATNFNEKAKKDDGTCTYKPTIELNGSATVSVAVGATYTDLGASATNRDGSSVEVVVTGLPISTASTGTFTVTYTATNDYGSVSATRTVNVILDQSSYLGTFAVTSDCSSTEFPIAGSPEITAGASANDIIITPAFSVLGAPVGEITATVNGATITIPQQTVSTAGGDIIVSGTGTMNSTGSEMIITYNYDSSAVNVLGIPIGAIGTCTATYVKQ